MNTAKLITLGLLRGSGAAAFSPLSISGLALWLDASDSTTLFQASDGTTPAVADADPVGYWADKSGNARNVTQATAGAKPTLKLAIQNGLNVLRFDGGDVLWIAALGATLSTSSLFVAFKQAINADFRLIQGTGDTNGHLIYKDAANYKIYQGTPLVGPAWNTDPNIITARFAANASSNVRLNGGTASTGNTGTATMSSLAVGANKAASTPERFFPGDCYEVIVVDGVVSDTIRGNVETYLASKWGITLSP